MHTAYIGLGSNLGDRRRTLERALRELDRRQGVRVARVSSFIETEPVGPPQPDYLNAAAELAVSLGPRKLLGVLHAVEEQFGRCRDEHWGPRTLDLDLLLYEDRVLDEPDIRVPHPRMHERRFVLQPLAEIAPNARHPVTGKTIRQLLQEVGGRTDGT